MQDDAVAAADQSVQLFTNQYKAGTISYLDLVVVQTALLNNKRTAVTILGNRMNAAVLLVKALGGGWNAADLPTGDDLAAGRDRSKQADAGQPASANGTSTKPQ